MNLAKSRNKVKKIDEILNPSLTGRPRPRGPASDRECWRTLIQSTPRAVAMSVTRSAVRRAANDKRNQTKLETCTGPARGPQGTTFSENRKEGASCHSRYYVLLRAVRLPVLLLAARKVPQYSASAGHTVCNGRTGPPHHGISSHLSESGRA